MSGSAPEIWSQRVAEALGGYAQDLIRLVAGRLLRHRSQWPVEELVDRIVAAMDNAAGIDRRLKDLPASCRKLLTLIGLSRRPDWSVGRLLEMLAALGHAEGAAPVLTLFEEGLLFPLRAKPTPKLRNFDACLAHGNGMSVFAHPNVTRRILGEDLGLPELPPSRPERPEPLEADGLEWPLRLALIWQQAAETPLRRTTSGDFFKRDVMRWAADSLINAPFAVCPTAIPDIGPLSAQWALTCGLLVENGGEVQAGRIADAWSADMTATVERLWQALIEVNAWDPENGWCMPREASNPFPSVYLLLLQLLARQPENHWLQLHDIGDWLKCSHPYWRADPAGEVNSWLRIVLYGLMFQLRLLECAAAAHDDWLVRLSPLGRWLASGNGVAPESSPFAPSLLVQANFEMLAFRQGLTPALVAELTRFARWKSLGAACQLELIADQVYRGLESGMTYETICRTLERHGMRPLPENVAEALRTWANKRERIVVFSDATLLEFESSADLDAAVTRGLVETRVSNRIGLVRDENSLDYRQLRLVGARDFAAKPDRCLTLHEDGVTLSVDAARSDLLLETELSRVAVPLNGVDNRERKYRLTRESLHAALARGASVTELDEWLTQRSGAPLSPAARLLAANAGQSTFQVDRCLVLRTPSPEFADGLVQLPQTRDLISDRLGPQALLVAEENLPRLREQIEALGQRVDLGGA